MRYPVEKSFIKQKLIDDYENIDPINIFVKIKTGKITRGHDFTLVKDYVRPFSFSQWTLNEWNQLSADCLHSKNTSLEGQDTFRFIHVGSR